MDSVSVLNPKLITHTHFSIPFIINNNYAPHSSFNLKTPRFTLTPFSNPTSLPTLTHPPTYRNHFTVAFAASHQNSEHGEIDVEKEDSEVGGGTEESQEAWQRSLDTFKEKALKFQGISQEAYEAYSKKAVVILNDTTEQLKIQADKAKQDLSVTAKELTEEGKEYFNKATENSPEVKEVVETFTSPTDDLSRISGIRDFYVGVPYGLILSLGGFVTFMVTGSTTAIRFGVILGGALLALSISSLKAYKRGQPSPRALKGQAAIASILSLREISRIGRGSSYVTALLSVAVVAFYVYRIVIDGEQQQKGFQSGEEK
ncbi:unnamed protein product [Lupinus luteus]|uniref:Protein FATTY ACID EXPORT 3, chloroplastic n=1 Tax=Lupinus luteus TaxID=3873 RepID=A0AAV1W511_LUPLU